MSKTVIEIEHPEVPATVLGMLSGPEPRDTYKKLSDFFRGLASGTKHAEVKITLPVAEAPSKAASPAPSKAPSKPEEPKKPAASSGKKKTSTKK